MLPYDEAEDVTRREGAFFLAASNTLCYLPLQRSKPISFLVLIYLL